MKFYWIKTNSIVKKLFSKYIWDLPSKDKNVYLTFDDGPTPVVTEWVLSQLKNHNAKATFFCIGKNIDEHPEILGKVIQDKHLIGNHTFNHLNGWKTETENYIENTKQCDLIIKNQLTKIKNQESKIFRPPYGKIKPSQALILRQMGYKIIMWDVLSADFDKNISPEKCLANVLSNVKSGSIIVFHDSMKAFQNLEYALPRTLAYLSENGYKCEALV